MKIYIGAGAMLLWAGTVYLLEGRQLLAFCLAVAAHELGHVLALWLLGFEIRALELRAFGLRLIYEGLCSDTCDLLSAAAGPVAGVIFAFFMCLWNSELASLCAGLSILLSAFNLLPVLPLDGGRICSIVLRHAFGEEKGAAIHKVLSLMISGLVLSLGVCAACTGKGVGLAIAGALLSYAALRKENTMKI